MKPILYFMLLLGISGSAWADVQIRYKDMTGATNTMRSNGHKVRINSARMPGYMLVDSVIETVYMVDKQRQEIIKFSAGGISGVEADKSLNVSLKPRGSGDSIAGYRTGRFDLIVNGEHCGSLNGSSELIKNRELKIMMESMKSMHKMSRMRMAGLGALSECQQANAQMTDLVETSGFVMRFVDDQGKVNFEVLSVKTDKQVAADYYDLPSGMKVVDMDEKMQEMSKQSEQMKQQMPELDNVMKQIQKDGKLDDDTKKQLEKMLEQLQSQ